MNKILLLIEEYLNTRFFSQADVKAAEPEVKSADAVKMYLSDSFLNDFDDKLKGRLLDNEKEEKNYDLILRYIKRTGKNFFKKNGELNSSAFCKYAMIDDSSLSNIRYNIGNPSRDTVLKLIFALKLTEAEAQKLLNRFGHSFCYTEFRDQLIISMLEYKIYEIESVYEVMEMYRNDGVHHFENLYKEKK